MLTHLALVIDLTEERLERTEIPFLRKTLSEDLEKLLKRLAKHGDRVFLEISEATRARLGLDLSAFQLVMVA